MSLRFVPPSMYARYAVFIDHGNGRGFFRTYDHLGSAKAAYRIHSGFGYRRRVTSPAKLLEMVEGSWYVLYDIPEGSTMLPWQEDKGDRGYYYRGGIQTVQMTREQYAEWRLTVERERLNPSATKEEELATQEH